VTEGDGTQEGLAPQRRIERPTCPLGGGKHRRRKSESDLSRLRDDIENLRKLLAEVASSVERVAYTPEERAKMRFDSLPPLLPESLASCTSGQELSLLLHTVVPDAIIPVKYEHRELTYRSPARKTPLHLAKPDQLIRPSTARFVFFL